MDRLVPLDGEPLPFDEPVQAIPDETSGVPPTGESPAPAPPVAEKKPDYVIPAAPELPTVQFADEPQKPKATLEPIEGDLEPYVEPPKKEADSWLDPKDYALARGAAEGLESIKGGKDFLTVLDLSFGGKSDEEKKKIILEQAPETAPTGWERRIPSVSDIGGVGDIATWFQESAASGAVSTMPSVIGGMAGAVGGEALAGPVGALVGAGGGAALPSMALGLSGMYQDMRSNEGVRKALQDGTITPDQFQKIVMVGGLMTGALDAIPAAHWGGKALGLDAAKKEIRETLIKAAIKGGFEEGGTESLQQVVSEVGQDTGGGTTSFGQQALNVLDAGLQGMVGGLIFGAATRQKGVEENHGAETQDKVDDTPEVSTETQPEGTPAAAIEAAAVPSTPGGIGNEQPQPAGTQKQPLPPVDPTAPTPAQPDIAGQPAPVTAIPAPTIAGGVSVVGPGSTAPDVSAALGASQPQVQPQVQEQALPEVDDEGDQPVTTADLADQEARIRQMFAAQRQSEAEQTQQAQAAQPAPANADMAAALRAGLPQQQPATAETLGTGQALQQTPQVTDTVAPPEAHPVSPPEALQPNPPATQPPLPNPAAAPGAEPVAAPAVTLGPAPEQAPDLAVREPAPVLAPEVAAGEAAVEPEARLEPMETPPLPLEVPASVAAFTPAEPAPRVKVRLSLKPKEAARSVAPGEKSARFKKARPEATERAAPSEAPEVQPEAKPAPAPAAEPQKAPRTQLSKDTAKHTIDLPELQRSTVSELPEFQDTVHDVAAEHVAENPRAKDQSPGDYIRKEGPKIAAKVKERLAAAEEEKAQADIKAKEMLTAYGRKQHAAQDRKAEMAEAETGQKKERAGKLKGKSAEGIRAEKEKATKSAYAKALKKPEAERDPSLMEWGRLDAEQVALPKTGRVKDGPNAGRLASDVREEIARAKVAAQEDRAFAAEERQAAGPPMTERAQAAERAATHTIESVALPEENGSPEQQVADINDHFDKFYAATKPLKLADHIDTKHQSPAENLVLYARKVQRNLLRNRQGRAEDYQGIGPTDFMVARKLYDEGAVGEMNDMIVSQQLSGTGYNEAIGEAPEQAWTEQEDEGERRQHEQETGFVESPDEQMRPKPAPSRGETRQGSRTIVVTRPSTGPQVAVEATTQKASTLLKDLGAKLGDTGGNKFWAILRRAHIRHLTRLVGDVDVHFVSSADMERLSGEKDASGLYFNYSNQKRYQGYKPMVFIDTATAADPADYAHTLLHEMTHAATSQAIADNIRGTGRIIEALRKGLEAQLQEIGIGSYELRQAGVNYGFRNASEFIAEAFSNERFQKILAQLPVSAELRKEIGALSRGKMTWWDTIVAAVSNAIGMVGGARGHTYMEQVMKLSPQILRSSGEQEQAALDAVFGGNEQPLTRAVPSGPLDEQALLRQFNGQVQGFRDKVSDYWHSGAAFPYTAGGMKNTWRTTGQLIRDSEDLFGGPRNAAENLAALSLQRDSTSDKYRASHGWAKLDPATGRWRSAGANEPGASKVDNNAVEKMNFELKRKSPSKFHRAAQWMDDATRWEVNASVPLSHADNSHVSKTGMRSADQRAMHAELAQRFAAFDPQTKATIKSNIEHYAKAGAIENDANIHYGVSQALKAYRKNLPAGKTIDDAVAWIRSGGPQRDAASQTQEDKDYHAAIGASARTLADAHELSRIKGVYAPMMRRGKFFISARENNFGTLHSPTGLPAGAVPAATPAALKKDGSNAMIDRLMFAKRADYDNFVNSFGGRVHGGTMWVDPKTGQKVPAVFQVADPTVPGGIRKAEKILLATVQNNRMEMSDSRSKLQRRAREMIAQGHKVAAIRLARSDLQQVAEDISPMQIKRLLKNFEQTTRGSNTASQDAIKGSIIDAQIRSMTRPSHLDRNLKRRNVLGNDIDMATSMRDYNRSLAHRLANFELGPKMAEADQALQEYMDQEAHRDYDDTKTLARNRMANEIRHRIKDMHYTSGSKLLKAVKDITAWRTLVSPHSWIINLMQPGMMTMPAFSGEYGSGVAWKTHMQTLRLGAVSRTLGHGFRETWRAGKKLNPWKPGADDFSHEAYWRHKISGEADTALLNKGIDELIANGYGESGGIELSHSSEADMNKAEIALSRFGDMFRQMPEAIEASNRYTTLITGIRLAKLAGLSDDLAVRKGVLDVERTQGGYAAANNPVIFSNPWLSPAAQFKKFSLAYGQLYYDNLAWTFGRNTDPALRKQAAKTLAGLSLTTVAMAGIYGLPVIELARMTMMMAGLMGLTDDDWDDAEASMQEWTSGMLKATGAGEQISEALFHGATRLAGVNTANNMSNSNLVTFNGPKSYDLSDLKDYAIDQLTGASGGFIGNMYKSLHSDTPSDAIPWPRVVKNVIDAYGLMTKGKVDPTTGEKYMDPVGAGQAAWKLLGFQTADEAREWEAGGGAYENKQDKKLRAERRTLMGRWANASPAERQRIYREDIRDFSRRQTDPRMRIDMGDLMRSKNERERERKDREKKRRGG